ncbi:MAG: hypothetical protein VX231_00400 [Pseudomonadota bacterium]|nr:hypothetical protein [Pseudomonadota bacterium]
MSMQPRTVISIALLFLSTWVYAGQREDVGYTQLRDRLGEKTPTGKGIMVSAYEPESHEYGQENSGNPMGWIPATVDGNDHISTIEMYQGAPMAIKSGNTSGHAAAVSRFMFGKEHGVSQALEAVKFHFIEDYIGYLLYPRTFYQATNPSYRGTVFESTVNNFSAISDFGQNNVDFLRRFDWATSREDTVNLISAGNNKYTNASAIFGSSLNGIYVGLTSGWHSRYTTQHHYHPQNRPDIVAPNINTSRGTGTITGITAVLMETASTAELSDLGLTQANTLIRNAERSETMKAILMAGADRTTANTRENTYPRDKDGKWIADPDGKFRKSIADINDYKKSNKFETANGLDTRYGAGQANVETSYDILMGAEQASLEDDGAQSVSLLGFDYDGSFGLGTKNQQSNGTATYVLPTIEEDSDIAITLAWNADFASYNGVFNAVAVYDLDLWLYQVIDNEEKLIAWSSSNTANTENIWAKLEKGGNYFFRVDTTKNLVALLWDYAIAWRVTSQELSNTEAPNNQLTSLNVATTSVPLPSSMVLFLSSIFFLLQKKKLDLINPLRKDSNLKNISQKNR